MLKKTHRDTVLFAHIQKPNAIWIKAQMKKLGYDSKRGKSEFLDALFSSLRAKKKAAVKSGSKAH